MASNQGREIKQALDDVDPETLDAMAQAIRLEVSRHSGWGTCQCPSIEALGVLYEKGYKVVRDG